MQATTTRSGRGARWAAVALVTWALVACGGGGSAPAPVVTPPPAPQPTPDPTPLPTPLTVEVPARAEVGVAVSFKPALAAAADLQVQWDFGDGGSSRELRPSHVYAVAGRYAWRVTVRNGAGQQVEASGSVLAGWFDRLAGSDCNAGIATGWCWQQPVQAPGWARSVDFVSDVLGFVVDGSGVLQIVGDQARVLSIVNTPEPLGQVRMVSADVGWALNATGNRLLRTLDGGSNWQLRGQPPLDVATVLLPRSADVVLVSGSQAGVLASVVSRDGGQSFAPAALVALRAGPADAVLGLAPGTPSGLVTAATLADPWRPTHASLDFGQTAFALQTCCGSGTLLAAAVPSAGVVDVLARAASGTIEWARSVDQGRSWARGPASGIGPGAFYSPVDRLDWSWTETFDPAVGARYQIYHSADQGRQWQLVGNTDGLRLAGLPLADLVPIDGQQLWARDLAAPPGQQTRVFDRVSGRWRTVAFAGEEAAPQVLQRAGTSLWLAGFASPPGRRWYVSADSGSSWRPLPGSRGPEVDGQVVGLWFFDARQGLLLRNDGTLQTTADGGRQWQTATRLNVASGARPPQLHVAPGGTAWVADGQRLHRSTDRGRNWQPVTLTLDFVDRVHFSSADKGWVQGQACQKTAGGELFACVRELHASVDGGRSFTLQAATDRYGMLYSGDRESLLLRVLGNQVLQSADGGTTWSEPQTVSNQNLLPVFVLLRAQGSSWIMSRNNCFGFCNELTLLRSDDAGRTWRAQALPVPAPGPQAMAFADARTGWLVAAGGRLLRTDDGGDSWQAQTSGTQRDLAAVFALDAYTAWVGGGNPATVLSTSTGGRGP